MARPPVWRRRSSGPWRRLDAASRAVFPSMMLVAGLFLLGLPIGLPGQAALRPVFAMGCVFFWSLYRPAALPAPVVAGLGLLLDLLGLTPFGLWAVLLLLLQAATIALRRRLVPARFLLTWVAFSGLAILATGLEWAVQSWFAPVGLPLAPAGLQIVLALALYPALAAFLIRAHRGPAAVELA